jgi:hypothetical protein
MRTVKLVVIGASGVGKTSLRGQVSVLRLVIPWCYSLIFYHMQYVSGRFSTGYRATIGTDFITKSLPDPRNPTEIVSLQIWVCFSPIFVSFFFVFSLLHACDRILRVKNVFHLSLQHSSAAQMQFYSCLTSTHLKPCTR